MNNEQDNQNAQTPPCFIHSVSNCPPIRFFNCDNIEIMKSVPDKYYDLAIVDPPYGLNTRIATSNHPSSMKAHSLSKFRKSILESGWDDNKPNDEYFEQLFRVSKNQIIWGGNYFDLWPSRCWVVWHKEVPLQTMSTIEMAWTSFDKPAKFFKYRSRDNNRFHPTQKPVKLYRYLLSNFAKQGMKILDTHGGSHTNAIACEIEGFDLDIIEIDPDYFRDGLNAFKMHIRQARLF